jgi:hypothetical protein
VDQLHAQAVLALLDADNTSPALVVLDGKVPTAQLPPYVLVYFSDHDPDDAESRKLPGASTRHVTRAYCHSVGGDQTAARAVAVRVRTALLDVIPTVAGRVCWPIRREEGQPVQRDEQTGAAVWDKVDLYRVESLPSSP